MSVIARIPNWVKDVIAFVFVVAGGLTPFGNPGRMAFSEYGVAGLIDGLGGFAIAMFVIPALLLPLRRRWPLAIFVACVGFFGVGVILGSTGPGAILASAIAMFGLAVRRNRRTTIVAAVATVVCSSVLLVVVGGSFADSHIIQVAVTIGFAAAAGEGTRARHAYIAAITDRAVRAEETRESEARRRVAEDRLRIAQDLHDVVAHEIAVISLNAGVASTTMESKPETAKEALVTIRRAARTVLGEIGELLTTLRLDSDGGSDGGSGAGADASSSPFSLPSAPAAPAAPAPGLDRLEALVARFVDNGLDVTTRFEGAKVQLPAATDVVAYRVVQEALTNAHKHGQARRAHLRVRFEPERVEIVVTNPVAPAAVAADGAAAAAGAADGGLGGRPAPSGHGLQGIRERVRSVRGTVEVRPTDTMFWLRVVLPAEGRTG
ncbi:sensor histidine kinase [Plantibacter sp. Mn2098]|uniref:sensor histidine kinase n=1 Tax=Plantibacter sp. Mn2098 TaxID=3395266 RepID=UPI003BD24CAA